MNKQATLRKMAQFLIVREMQKRAYAKNLPDMPDMYDDIRGLISSENQNNWFGNSSPAPFSTFPNDGRNTEFPGFDIPFNGRNTEFPGFDIPFNGRNTDPGFDIPFNGRNTDPGFDRPPLWDVINTMNTLNRHGASVGLPPLNPYRSREARDYKDKIRAAEKRRTNDILTPPVDPSYFNHPRDAWWHGINLAGNPPQIEKASSLQGHTYIREMQKRAYANEMRKRAYAQELYKRAYYNEMAKRAQSYWGTGWGSSPYDPDLEARVDKHWENWHNKQDENNAYARKQKDARIDKKNARADKDYWGTGWGSGSNFNMEDFVNTVTTPGIPPGITPDTIIPSAGTVAGQQVLNDIGFGNNYFWDGGAGSTGGILDLVPPGTSLSSGYYEPTIPGSQAVGGSGYVTEPPQTFIETY